MKIAFLLYPTASVKVDEDSSFWIMHELARRGHAVSHFESSDLVWSDGAVRAYLTAARTHVRRGFLPSPRSREATPLESLDAVFIRKEPPFDEEYLHTLQLLMRLRRPFVVNDPAGIALCNEKLMVLDLHAFAPESLVTNRIADALKFLRGLRSRAVIKPLDNKAGYGVFLTHTRDKNLRSLFDQATQLGRRKVIVQRYVPHERTGDKRILLLDGEFLACFMRRPPRSDFRANLSVGGSMHRASLSAREKKLLRAAAPILLRHGLYFAGLDVIGGYLSEINVTSPSGIPEIKALEGRRLEKDVADFIERLAQ